MGVGVSGPSLEIESHFAGWKKEKTPTLICAQPSRAEVRRLPAQSWGCTMGWGLCSASSLIPHPGAKLAHVGFARGPQHNCLKPHPALPKVNPSQSFPSRELGGAAGIVLKGSSRLVPSCAMFSLSASQMLKSSLEKLWLVWGEGETCDSPQCPWFSMPRAAQHPRALQQQDVTVVVSLVCPGTGAGRVHQPLPQPAPWFGG